MNCTAFQFDFLRAPWRATILGPLRDDAISAARVRGGPANVGAVESMCPAPSRGIRGLRRTGLVGTDWERARWAEKEADHELGRRARACALLQLALPGTAYIYQG